MSKRLNLIGKKFYRLLVIAFAYVKNNKSYWWALCNCGEYVIINGKDLKRGNVKSCGCYRREKASEINEVMLNGQKFGRLLVISPAYRKNHHQFYQCLCDCGTKRIVQGSSLKNGHTKSCGCLQIEKVGEINKGKIISIETRQKMSEAKKGRNRNKSAGKKHWNWKGGITLKNQEIRNSLEYKKWRDEVYKRDNYICQICGKSKSGNLRAHHLWPFNIYDFIRFEVWNGITVCENCHCSLRGKETETARLFLLKQNIKE